MVAAKRPLDASGRLAVSAAESVMPLPSPALLVKIGMLATPKERVISSTKARDLFHEVGTSLLTKSMSFMIHARAFSRISCCWRCAAGRALHPLGPDQLQA